MSETPLPFRDPACAARLALIASSYRHLIGSDLVDERTDLVSALWNAPAVILAHGREDDPRFFFANAAALVRFDTDLDAMIGMPSRHSAEAPSRAERQTLLDRVSRDGFIADYAGVRVSLRGKRFRIEQALVWNLIDADGAVHGQAAAFSRWSEL